MSGNTEATSSSDPVVTPIPDPVQIMDIDGDLTIMNEPDWDKMEGDTLKEHLQDMFKANQQLLELLNLRKQGKKEDGDIMKLKRPGPYDGKSDKLRAFIAELRYYIRKFPRTLAKEEDKVAFAATCLEGTAKSWFQPFWEDHEGRGPTGEESEDTKQMYGSIKLFEDKLVNMFLDQGEQRALENKISKLKQEGKCSNYVVKFNELATKLNWGNEPLKKLFYDGLAIEVKKKVNEFRKKEITLQDFQAKAIEHDNLLFELRQEEKRHVNKNNFHQANQGKKRDDEIAKDNSGKPGKMDLDMMQKDKRKDFKCYNCGKPNHMARNCKSPKKERSEIPAPKTTHAMEKETRSILLFERSGSPENNDDYEFYESTSDLSDDSETLDHEAYSEIPDRQPTRQIDFSHLATLIQDINEDYDEDYEWRNYGCNLKDDREIIRTYDNFTPEIRRLNEFHHDIVEAANAEVENTPMVLYAFLNATRKQEQATQHIIRAVTTDQALRQNPNYQRAIGEHDHIDPNHAAHHRISWTDCITHRCMEHFKKKVEFNTFPTRIPMSAIMDPHDWSYCYNWGVTQRYRSLKVVVLEPKQCPDETSLYGCTTAHCKVHDLAKILDWQRIQDERKSKESCEHFEEDWKDCDVIECPKHAENKIRNWHVISKN